MVLALGLEASSGTQDPMFLMLHFLRAHGEFTEHSDNTGDGLGSGCPWLSSGPGCCIGYIKATWKGRGLPPAELSELLLLYWVTCMCSSATLWRKSISVLQAAFCFPAPGGQGRDTLGSGFSRTSYKATMPAAILDTSPDGNGLFSFWEQEALINSPSRSFQGHGVLLLQRKV